jgi:effector-binding domain-containing protein
MKILKYVVFLLLILVIGFSIFVAVQPNSFKVSRSKIIQAPQSVIYNNVIDFKNWKDWSSWVEKDPSISITLAEQTKGIDGSYSWEDKNGVSRMKTIAAKPSTSITQEMQVADYPKSDVNWTFEAIDEETTKVTWQIEGKDLPFGFKMAIAFMGSMDDQIGPDYERSLTKLDSVIQAEMKVYSINVKGETQHSGGFYLYKTTSCKLSAFEKNKKEMLDEVGTYALTHNVRMAGTPFIIYHKKDFENDAVMFSCAIPTNSKIVTEVDSEILTGQLNSFKAVKTVLRGNTSNLDEAWNTTMNFIADHNLKIAESGPMLETYITDRREQPNPAEWVTEIYVAIEE